MPPDPAQPMLDLPGSMAAELAATVAAIAPAVFGLLVVALLAGTTVALIRRSL